jgi:small-conductance mechanosensitive channel
VFSVRQRGRAMKKTIVVGLRMMVFLLPAMWTSFAVAYQQKPGPDTHEQSVEAEVEALQPAGEIVIDGRSVLTVREAIGTYTPQQRAAAIEGRIISLAKLSNVSPDLIRIQQRDVWTEIVLDNTVIMVVTDADAEAAGIPRGELATEYQDSIHRVIVAYRQEHGWKFLLLSIFKTIVATAILICLIWLVLKIRTILLDRVKRKIREKATLHDRSAQRIWAAYIGPLLLTLGSILRWVIILGLIEAYLTITFGFYSSTREISLTVTSWTLSQLTGLTKAGVDYLPKLLLLCVITLVTTYVVRLVRMIFGEIEKGNITFRGFYPDWAEPTEKLVRALILVLALVVAFPYLPGASSPAFKGISVFLGVLVSLGSSSAVANAVAGVILTYMRSFLVGDWVQIGETTGEVIEKTLLVTRVLTPKAEIITIPNATIMGGAVKNFSTEAKKNGVIFHTTATIGYNAPWRTVHELLINAALATEHVLREPAPFVLQERLEDFYVAYELNAYTDSPREMLNIYSDLHKNIQDRFNQAGVEICSPHFSSLRDGNSVAIPDQYVRTGHEVPGFRINVTGGEDAS